MNQWPETLDNNHCCPFITWFMGEFYQSASP
jgi:hypothetical protein